MANKPKPKAKPAPKKPANKRSSNGLTRVGALWVSEGRNGRFMSGRIELTEGDEVRVLVFKNGFKEQSKHPDYLIYVPDDEEPQAGGKTPPVDEDIPF